MTPMEIRINQSRLDSYCDRIKALGVTVDINALKEKLQKLDSKFLTELLNKIVSSNDSDIISALKAIGVNAISNKITTEQAKDEVKKKLNLSDVTEFENDKKDYFKFKDKNGNITVTRNMGDDSKQLFLGILNNSDVASKEDGKDNARDIFEYLNNYKLIEIGLKSSKNIENDNNTKVDEAVVKEMQKRFPDKEIMYSTEERLYIVKGPNGEKDTILGINNKDGRLSVNKLEQKGYDDQDTTKKEETNSYNEQDISLNLENDEEINKIVLDNAEKNVADEITMRELTNQINERYPQYRNRVNLNAIIAGLIARIRENGRNNSIGGRQYVLTNNNAVAPTNVIPRDAA